MNLVTAVKVGVAAFNNRKKIGIYYRLYYWISFTIIYSWNISKFCWKLRN